MKAKVIPTLQALWLALALAGLAPLRAEDTPPANPPPAAQPAAAANSVKKDEADSAKAAPATEQPVAATAPTPATTATAAVVPPADDEKNEANDASQAQAQPPKAAAAETKAMPERRTHRRHGSENDRVGFFSNSTLAAGQEADAVVSVFGSSTSAGDAHDAVVSVLGSSTSSGNVADAVVSVVGNTRVTGGTVGDAAVAVLGSTYVNGHVNGPVVAVLGNVELGPDAVVGGDVVCIGGELKRAPEAVVHGSVQNIAVGGHHFNFDGLHAWFEHCLLYARPLAFDREVLWAWLFALVALAFYSLVALAAPGGVTKCVQTLEERPGYSILAAVLVLLLTPVAYLLLVLTLAIAIGFVLIPLLSLGLFLAGIFGRVVMLAWLGRRLSSLFGGGPPARPALSVIFGGVVVLLLYTVPVLGFIVYKLLGLLGMGVVLYTVLLSFKESRKKAAASRAEAAATATAAKVAAIPAGAGDAGTPVAAVAPVVAPPPLLSASTLPRAGFWIRIAAVLLDIILAGIVFGMLRHMLRPLGASFPLWFAAYNVLMWGAKGTTIGGIVCNLKIVRLDDRPVDWGVAVVRGLGAFLSLAVAGLGFIWVAFDDEKQSWHDKIAGTTIVKVPRGTPLM